MRRGCVSLQNNSSIQTAFQVALSCPKCFSATALSRYQRNDSANTNRSEGLGVGLSALQSTATKTGRKNKTKIQEQGENKVVNKTVVFQKQFYYTA